MSDRRFRFSRGSEFPLNLHFLQPPLALTGVSRALPARSPKKSLRESPGPSGQKVFEAVSRQSPESRKRLFRDSGDCFETASDTFSSSGAGRRWEALPRLLGFRALWARETPLRGGRGCKQFSPVPGGDHCQSPSCFPG